MEAKQLKELKFLDYVLSFLFVFQYGQDVRKKAALPYILKPIYLSI